MEMILALTPSTNEAFVREVDDELRRDQMVMVWRRFGILIVLAVLLALAAFGGWLYWQHRQTVEAGEQGERLNTALQDLGDDKVEPAKKALAELSQSDIEGYRASALMLEADLALQKDDLKGAAQKFATLASDEEQPQPVRDLALIRQTLAEYDSLKPQTVIDRLRGFATKDSPWFGAAGEMVAVAYLSLGKRDVAAKLFGEIAQAETVPESVRQRTVQMASVLGVDAVDQDKEQKTQ